MDRSFCRRPLLLLRRPLRCDMRRCRVLSRYFTLFGPYRWSAWPSMLRRRVSEHVCVASHPFTMPVRHMTWGSDPVIMMHDRPAKMVDPHSPDESDEKVTLGGQARRVTSRIKHDTGICHNLYWRTSTDVVEFFDGGRLATLGGSGGCPLICPNGNRHTAGQSRDQCQNKQIYLHISSYQYQVKLL